MDRSVADGKHGAKVSKRGMTERKRAKRTTWGGGGGQKEGQRGGGGGGVSIKRKHPRNYYEAFIFIVC